MKGANFTKHLLLLSILILLTLIHMVSFFSFKEKMRGLRWSIRDYKTQISHQNNKIELINLCLFKIASGENLQKLIHKMPEVNLLSPNKIKIIELKKAKI